MISRAQLIVSYLVMNANFIQFGSCKSLIWILVVEKNVSGLQPKSLLFSKGLCTNQEYELVFSQFVTFDLNSRCSSIFQADRFDSTNKYFCRSGYGSVSRVGWRISL